MWRVSFISYLILATFTAAGTELYPDHHYVLKRSFGKINGTSGQKFMDLLRGDFYIDTTYILKDILKQHKFKTLIMTLPSKWGKSINLDMIKTFLEIPVDNRQKRLIPRERTNGYRLFYMKELMLKNGDTQSLFRPLYISFCNLVLKQHQGKYPVIFLDFGDINGSTYTAVVSEIGQRIKEAFAQHEYMITVLINQIRNYGLTASTNCTAQKLNGFMRVFYEKADYNDLIESLELLSRILYEYFHSKVFILLDNYEGVLLNVLANNEISESESPMIIAFLSSLMVRSFQANKYLEKGILTGSFKMLNLIPHLTNVTDYKTAQNSLLRLCSIDHDVLISIFDRLNIPSIVRSKAINWYSGYHWGKDQQYSVYSPQSITNFLTTGRINYLKKRHRVFDSILQSIFRYQKMRTYFLWLLYSKPILIGSKDIKQQQVLGDFIKFKEALLNAKNPFDEQSIEPYFCAIGILAIVRTHGSFGSHVRIPNHAVRMEVAMKLMQFYEKTYNLSTFALNKATANLATFLSSDDTKLQDVITFFHSITGNEDLMTDFAQSKVKEEEIFELFLCFIFNYITFQITLSYDYQIESVEKIELNKWILFNHCSVTFIQFRVNASSAEHVLNISKNHATTMPQFTRLPIVKFVGINFQPDGVVNICTESHNGPFELISDYTTKPQPIYVL